MSQTSLFDPVPHGRDGAAAAAKHFTDRAPGWVQHALGDAFLAMRGRDFTSDDVRQLAGPTVDAWLTDKNHPVRRNLFSGWWQARCERYHLERVGVQKSERPEARGRLVSVWRFPVPMEAA